MPEMLREEALGRLLLGWGDRTPGDGVGERTPARGGESSRSLQSLMSV